MPTIKQKAVLDKILENPAKPVSEAMIEVGYKPGMAKNPHDLLESKGFIQLLNEHGLDDQSLAKRHKELLQTDDNIAIKALDLAYKVKGSYAPDKSLNVNINASVEQNPKTKALADEYEAKLMETYQND